MAIVSLLVIVNFSLFLSFNSDFILRKYNRNEIDLPSASASVASDWYKTWGGSSYDRCYAIALDSSENIYLGGCTNSFGAGNSDMCLVKYDISRVQQWNVTWGGSEYDHCFALALDSSENIYLAGHTGSFGAGSDDICLVKYDSSGVQQWNVTWGGTSNDHCEAIALDSSENIYLAGYTYSFGAGSSDMCLVKYDSSGAQQWNVTWGGNSIDHCYALALDSSENIYLAGYTESFGAGGYDICLVKYDSSGVQQWNVTWGGTSNDHCEAIALDLSENIYLAGYTYSFGAGSSDMCLVKYDSSGVQQWNLTWGGSSGEGCYALALDSSENIYLGGYTGGFGAVFLDMCLVKYDSSGVQQYYLTWGGGSYDVCDALALDSSENIYLAGYTYSFGAGSSDMCFVIPVIPPESFDPLIFILILIVISIVVVVSSIITIKVRKRSKPKRERKRELKEEIAREKAEEQARIENDLKLVKAENQRIIAQAKLMVEAGQWSEAIETFKKSKEISVKQNWSDLVRYDDEMISKCKVMKERQREEKVRRDKIERIMQVSSRIRLDTMRDVLNLEPKIFHERLIDWAEEFGFDIDGDYLNVNKDKVSDFIEKLDNQFSDWEQKEKDRIGKK